jgi:signal transduction histidine kinase
MMEPRAEDIQLEDSVRSAIAALPEPSRSALMAWIAKLREESARAEAAGREGGSTAGAEPDLERERTRLARELHDTIGGDLAASIALFKFYFENHPSRGSQDDVLRNIFEVLESTLHNLRGMLRSLRSRDLGPAGLVGDLTEMASAYQRFHGLDVLLKVIGDEQVLSRGQQEVVFQVVREALSNVRRHSESGTALVTCLFAQQPFVVEIRDWGNGFVNRHGDGFGLVGMRERAAGIGGRLQIVAAPGRGTSILLFGPQPSLDD